MQAEGRFVKFARDDVETSVPERFERQAALYPDHIAVKTRFQRITYSEFNKSANQIARAVRQHSSNDRPIALLLDHDLPAIVAIFAALKAAKCFVPLDPALPLSRLEYMLVDSGAQLVVTNNQRWALAHKVFDPSRVVNIDQIDRSLETENLGIPISSETMSCILYTSGTTGRPKGVVHTHRNELHNVMHHTNSLSLTSDDRFTLFGSYCTGQGMQDFYCALLNGATLHPWNLKLDGLGGIAEWLYRDRITVYHSAATVFRYFVKNLSDGEEFPALRIIRLGSEQVTWKDLESYKRHFSKHSIFVNALSSSETKTIRQYIANKETQITGIVPIGYPVPDMEILMLDEYGNELGPGQFGEIAVRSQFLSPGYWRSLELTNAGFRAEPAGSGSRIFRTGEWGRLSADGCLDHLGRRDAQIKIRGYRVETNEIELALLRHPVVDQVLVLCRDNIRGDKYLAAYIVLEGSLAPGVSELRNFLKDRLPDYMIPSAFIFLESLPLTPNGKVDRSALPEPTDSRPVLDVPFVPPTGQIEEVLTSIWALILGIREIGVHDNHFDLGGNSLTAMQVVARVEKIFGVRTPLSCFFESPTIASLSRIISMANDSAERGTDVPLERVARDQNLPLSFPQQRLWFLDQWEPGNASYNICRAHYLRETLNVGAFEDSVNSIVQRHEILRTSFPASDGQPTQVIAPVLSLRLEVIDLQQLPKSERYEQSIHIAKKQARRPFDLERGPLLRAMLIRLDGPEWLIVFTVHQIVCDGWSMQIFYRELWTSYKAFSAGRRPGLPDLPFQYSDFAVWQRKWLRDELLVSRLNYWKHRIGSGVPRLNLPTDRSRLGNFRGARQSVMLPEALSEALKDLSRRAGLTLFITLMAAFKTLLSRYTGQVDLVVGFPIANRNWGATEDLIGFFVNTLVLRTDLSDNPTFSELLIRVRHFCSEAYTYQDLPFERLVEELHPNRELGRNPLFQVMFVLQVAESTRTAIEGLASEPLDVDAGTSKFDLTLSLTERDKKLTGSFEYSTDLFDHPTIERMVSHFQTLLEGIVENPDQRISDLPILTEAERHKQLVEWNNTEADYPKESCIHEMFQEQAERTPEAMAVEFGEKKLTYRELNARANQLAYYFRHLGVGPERPVGICLKRSLEMMIGLLGILKAGGAYVPLDPEYPKERLAFMLEDARLSVLLTQKGLIDPRSSILDRQSLKVVYFDQDWQKIAQHSTANPECQANADNLAYVIYTSASTGKPKGIQVSHRSVINCLHSMRQQLGVTEKEILLAVTTISFDIAALELYLPLITGAKVVLAGRDEALDGIQLLNRLSECDATAMQATPSTWRLLLEAGWHAPKEFKILCGGEFLPRELADQLLADGASLWNLYGPTETTIWSSIAKAEPGEGPVPIGRPIANTQIYILDSHLQPVPVGVHGELYIGGDGLARGYLNRPELTAEKFVVIPFSDQPGSRLYRTGDLARYRADGNIEFLGRIDNQVKIRGYRVELGEIEAALNQHSSVRDSVVVAREDVTDEHRDSGNPITKTRTELSRSIQNPKLDRHLVAYIVPTLKTPSVTDLRSFLKEKLPEFMLPSVFVPLDALPLTPNGKIDRNALPPPNGARPQLVHEFVAPRSEIDELVTQVWREVLKLDKIGVYDNFFDLGGHSLLATRVVARLRSSFNVDIALSKLFELPTVAGLARHVDLLRHSEFGTNIAPIVPVDRTQALPLSFSQRRLWYLHKVDTNLSAYNIPAAFRVKGDLDSGALEQALNEMIARHEVLRSYVKEVDGQPRQEIFPSLRIALPVIDLTCLPDEQAETKARHLFSAEARQLYDLAIAPLMRAALVKLANDKYVFILNFHHVIADGSSLAIFYTELAALYAAARDSKAVSLPRLPVQYADYAAWQHEWLKSSSFDAQLGYWEQQLAGLPEPCELPTDFDRPMLPTYRGARLALQLSEELTESLRNLSRQQSVTIFMTLFATFNILLSRISGQEDIVTGSTIAGRNHPETDGLIGFFINALPLRCDLVGDPSFVTLLQRVREFCLDAYTNQDVPFEKIVEALRPPREPWRNPIFDILFNVADISERVLALTGCEVTKFSPIEPAAKFDIVLYAPEVDGKIELAISYNTALFREGRITLLLEQYAALLDQVANNPGLPIGQLSLITDESRALLPDPTQALDDKWESAIHELLAEQARRSPLKLAIVDPEQTWTYAELDRCANQLANRLIAYGIQRNDLIAIYAHRSSPLVLALFGILKAGASFLILDPTYPVVRSIEYLRIAQPKGWLRLGDSGELPDELSSSLDNLQLRFQMNVPQSKAEILDNLSAVADTEPATIVTADDPAYVAFTSGSTGEPKGVVCRHGPITHFLPWQKQAFKLQETDRFAMLSGLAYSHLHRDVFTALSLGATLYIPNPSETRSPERLTQWLERNDITVLHLTPALGQLLLTSSDARLPSVRRVFFGGDVLTMEEVARIRRLAPHATISSFYGATETQRAVGYYEIVDDPPSDDNESTKPVPLGRGIKDVQLLVLNKSGQLAGVGELGELFVRSPHLAEGYVGDEIQTAQMFVVNPFTNDPKDRLYRTGELGRYLPGGNVEWSGRNDRRVNIRGFRVELEEIEVALKQHRAVKDAAVVLRDYEIPAPENSKRETRNPKLDRHLVAYIAADEEQHCLADLLQSFLSTRLPDYMVPAHFMVLERLPLSPNGKVDYRALPRVEQFSSSADSSAAPRNEIETKLCVIFAQVLGRDQVGIDENFFRIGGHSLLAARAAVRICDAFGIELELSTFLETPTVMGLAKEVESLTTSQTGTESDKDQREEFDL